MTLRHTVLVFLANLSAMQLIAQDSTEASLSIERKYSATAYISFLGIPIFSRSGVGHGFAGFERHVSAGKLETGFTFLSATDPARAHGLNRFGFMREEVAEIPSSPREARYLAFMTAAGEETLQDAKAALNTPKTGDLAFVAAQGTLSGRRFRYQIQHFFHTPESGSANVETVVSKMQAELSNRPREENAHERSLGKTDTATFLWSVWRAATAETTTQAFSYNGKDYQLRSERKADKSVGEELVRQGLAAGAEDVMVVNCFIVEHGNQISAFRLWYDQRSANWLPLRFEFRPKTYLRLVYQTKSEEFKTAKNLGGRVTE